MPRDLLAQAPLVPRDLLAQSVQLTPQQMVDKSLSTSPLQGQRAPLSAYGDIAKGAVEGVPSGITGSLGDVESLGRLALSTMGVSRENFMPTSSQMADKLFGPAQNSYQSGGRTIGGFLSPLVAVKGMEALGKGAGFIAKEVTGLETGSGPRAIQEGFNAGQEGGQTGQAFADAMRGNTTSTDIVDMAKDAVGQLKSQRSAAYQAGLGNTIKGDATVLDFKPVNDAIAKTMNIGSYKGVPTIPGASKVRDKIIDLVNKWQGLDPADFHTPEGMDELKKAIWNLKYDGELESVAAPGKPGSKILDAVANAVKDQIVKQAPGYAEVMKDYSSASDEIQNIEKSLSLGHKAAVDTSLRKLQSILRNNVNTNFGARTESANALNKIDPKIFPTLAGQSMNAIAPRGIGRATAAAELPLLLMHPAAWPAIAATAAASSPRLVGEAAYGLGRLTAPLARAAPLGFNDPRLLPLLMPQIAAGATAQQPAYAVP